MKIAFASMGNPRNPRTWSGTPFFALREVEKRFDDIKVIHTPVYNRVAKVLKLASRKLGLPLARHPLVVRMLQAAVNRQLRDFDPDVIVAVGGATKIAHLAKSIPVIFVSDGLMASMVEYYPRFQAFDEAVRKRMMAVERDMVEAPFTHLLMMADWAAEGALKYYDIPPERVSVAPIGANLLEDPGVAETKRDKSGFDLLWIGVEWERKGGDEMLEVFRRLKQRLPEARLHIVGLEEDAVPHEDGVIVHGYLRKSEPAQYSRLLELFRLADLFIMFSRQEAFGLVYCEAAAFGLPCVGFRTGGVRTIVQDEETGLLFDSDADAQLISDEIVALLGNGERLERMSHAARARFEEHLNWNAWGEALEKVVSRALAAKQEHGKIFNAPS